MRRTGYYEKTGNIEYFIPYALPPKDPPLILNQEMTILFGETMHEIGMLNEISSRLPNVNRFIKAYTTKEALLSSDIEGINTTMLEIFTQPLLDTKPSKNIQLVMNYTKALDKSIELLNNGLPISSRILIEAHKELMEIGEGDKFDPGNFRKQPVRVGELIPPPAYQIPKLITDLENYINLDQSLPPLLKAGLAHVQFETIHPFLDGNGRIGRLLIVLMLIDSKLLSQPIIYPSYFFKKNQLEYYYQLDIVRTKGDFESWLLFYLKIIKNSCIDAYKRALDIELLEKTIIEQFYINNKSEKTVELFVRALNVIFNTPVISIKELATKLNISYNTSNKIIDEFVKQEILTQETKQKRNRLYKFSPYFEILEKKYL